jgi:CheY-like chemotaxis protein
MTATSLLTLIAGPHVLVVDADVDNRELYRDSLTLAGWSVSEAVDGRDALVQALAQRPALIITELRLPLIDGVSLCELLRRDRATADVPILVVTAETRTMELARAERAGANAVLVKPSTPDVVVAEMRRLLALPNPSSVAPLPSPAGRRTALVKAHRRIATTTPPDPPADLSCPMCGRALGYQKTYTGGVSSRHPERWDYYSCGTCGEFQYRYRTRKLRQL